MVVVQDTRRTIDEVVSEQIANGLTMLSWTPYLSVDEMAARNRRGTTSTRKHLNRAENAGLVTHVMHGLHGRKGRRRYMLTGKGVETLAEMEQVRVADIMGRPGTTGRALATYHRRIDILEGVYRTAATIAACSDEPELQVHIPREGPLDGLVRMPESRRSFGVMAKRPVIDDNYFGLHVWRYKV
ncbi:MAG: hypothetical protein F4Z35_01890, partial [Dehalococcoidia bacterium]|nr:hypothetical protein [Dehalococcoidia bacterium]